jgi:hypothetical protein
MAEYLSVELFIVNFETVGLAFFEVTRHEVRQCIVLYDIFCL